MQSLVLATSLLLSSQSPVITTDVAQELASFVQNETSRVTQFIQNKEHIAVQNTSLFQPQSLIGLAKQVKTDELIINKTAE